MSRKVPEQKPGRSEQVVATPPEFLTAVRNRFSFLLDGKDFAYDLAANEENAVVKPYFSEEDDSLIQEWHKIKGVSWLNPPYEDLKTWTSKAAMESLKGAEVFMLVPASVGANWWRDYVDEHAAVYFLNGRLTFIGHKTPYPKDLALLLYNRIFSENSYYSVWNWRLNQ